MLVAALYGGGCACGDIAAGGACASSSSVADHGVAAAVGHEGGADRMGSNDGPADGNGGSSGAGPPGCDSCSSRPGEIVNSGRAGRAWGGGGTDQETTTTTTTTTRTTKKH